MRQKKSRKTETFKVKPHPDKVGWLITVGGTRYRPRTKDHALVLPIELLDVARKSRDVIIIKEEKKNG